MDEETHERDFPYGKYPRLIMAWMAKQIRSAHGHRTDTVDPETRTITIPTINRLCDEMGVGHGGKTAEAVQEQLRRLLAARISVRRRGASPSGKATRSARSSTCRSPAPSSIRTMSGACLFGCEVHIDGGRV